MKKILLAVVCSVFSISTLAAPDEACLSKVKVRTAEAIELFGDVKANDIEIKFLNATQADLRPLDDEPPLKGYRVYTRASYNSTVSGHTVFLNESGVIPSGKGEISCQVLYTKPGVGE